MKTTFLLLLLLLPQLLISSPPPRQIKIIKTNLAIKIDGILDDAPWQNITETATEFWQNFPSDTSTALSKTEVKITYDDEFIYIAAVCYDEVKGSFISQSLKRDFSYPVNDAFAVFFDPFNDRVNGYNFTVSPLGVQREGLVATGGTMGVSTDWDCTWYSAVTVESNKWNVEIAIPLKVLKFSDKISEWGINFSRNDLKRNESSVWSRVPKNFNIASLAYTGLLIWDKPPIKKGKGLVLIPYVIGNASMDHINDSVIRITPNAGIDAKIPISNSLNLDITINPDFSQVEVDRQVTNLTRFSIFFPEKRNFFIENSDLFDRYGFRQIRPFFSRRIGLDAGEVIPIYGGIRLSGKINKNWRIGVMNMQTAESKKTGLPAENFGVFALQRTVFIRSNVAFIFVNRESFFPVTATATATATYNRIAGLDYNLNSADNKWFGKAFFHYSFNPVSDQNNYAHATFIKFDDGKWGLEWNHEYVGENYLANTGFVPRRVQYDAIKDTTIFNAYWRIDDEVNYYFYPKSKLINKHGPKVIYSQYLDKDLESTEILITNSYNFKFQAGHEATLLAYYNEMYLPWLTDVSFSTGIDTLSKGYYDWWNYEANFKSTERKLIYMLGKINVGNYFTGTKLTYSADIIFRVQPWGLFTLNLSQDEIELPAPLPSASITLLGAKIELSFSKSFFFSSFLQYNTQADNINLNCRLQWRYKPMSDVFLVYTDNRYSTDLGPKYQALVLKVNYWLNL